MAKRSVSRLASASTRCLRVASGTERQLARARGLQGALADEAGFQRVEVVDGDDDAAFRGRKIGKDGQRLTAYLTPRGTSR